ncbi:MAG: hypothetical protein WDA27_11435 [Actinomycetota bacterium]
MKAKTALAAVGIGVSLAGAWVGVLSRPTAIAAVNPPEAFRDRLVGVGAILTPLDDARAAQVASAGVTADQARRLAEHQFQRATFAGIYLGGFTDTKQHVGETENSPLSISDVPAYVVLLDDASMYLRGPWRGEHGRPPKPVSVSVAVFIDALSGAQIMSTTL